MHHITQRALRARIERPAGREHQPAAWCIGIDAGVIEADHGSAGDAEAEYPAVAARDLDMIAHAYISQERKVRVTVRRIDRGALFADLRRALELARPERQRLTTCTGEHNRALAEPRHGD